MPNRVRHARAGAHGPAQLQVSAHNAGIRQCTDALDCAVCVCRQHARRGHESTPARAFIDTAAERYVVLTYSEYFTSQKCWICACQLARTRGWSWRHWRCPHNPLNGSGTHGKQNNQVVKHGKLRHVAEENKDVVAALALFRIALNALVDGGRPIEWCADAKRDFVERRRRRRQQQQQEEQEEQEEQHDDADAADNELSFAEAEQLLESLAPSPAPEQEEIDDIDQQQDQQHASLWSGRIGLFEFENCEFGVSDDDDEQWWMTAAQHVDMQVNDNAEFDENDYIFYADDVDEVDEVEDNNEEEEDDEDDEDDDDEDDNDDNPQRKRIKPAAAGLELDDDDAQQHGAHDDRTGIM